MTIRFTIGKHFIKILKHTQYLPLASTLILFLLIGCTNTQTIIFENNASLRVEVAKTTEQKSLGLMNRQKLCENCGMVFIYNTPETTSFWMKNTLIPLDAIWINENNTIIGITQMTPCITEICESYSSPGKIKYVIETNTGWSEKNNITLKQNIKILE